MKRLLFISSLLLAGVAQARSPQGTINGPSANGAFPAGDTQPVTFAIAVEAKKATCTTFLLTGGVQGKCDLTPLFSDGFVLHGNVTTTGKTNETTTVPYDILVSPPFNCTPSSKTASACSIIIQARAVATAPPVVTPPPVTPPVVTPPAPAYTWAFLKNQFSSFDIGGPVVVRYGKDPRWVQTTVNGYTMCTATGLGVVDPAPELESGKTCEVRTP